MLKYKIKIPALCFAVTVIAAMGIVTAFAVTESLRKEKDNEFVPAVISLAVIENDVSNTEYNLVQNLNWTKEDDNYTADKLVKIANLDKENENNADAYIRVCIIPRWTADINIDANIDADSKLEACLRINIILVLDIVIWLCINRWLNRRISIVERKGNRQ